MKFQLKLMIIRVLTKKNTQETQADLQTTPLLLDECCLIFFSALSSNVPNSFAIANECFCC
jgi:hypothetical protein